MRHSHLSRPCSLISDDWAVCVTDFGVSKMMTQEMSKAAGTPMYMSPEILNGKPYSLAADTYSFAFIVWELVARIVSNSSSCYYGLVVVVVVVVVVVAAFAVVVVAVVVVAVVSS